MTSIFAQGSCCYSERDLPEFNRIRLKSVGYVYVKIGNEQKVRVDFRPAYGVMNPFFAGQGHGN